MNIFPSVYLSFYTKGATSIKKGVLFAERYLIVHKKGVLFAERYVIVHKKRILLAERYVIVHKKGTFSGALRYRP